MDVEPQVLGEALAARIADIEAALERYGAFAFEPGGGAPAPALAPGERAAAARELMLRALRTAADPVGFAMLRRLAEGDATLDELVGLVSLPRLSVWERVNDLVQAGLAGRSLEQDRAGLTPLGRVLVGLVETAVGAAGES